MNLREVNLEIQNQEICPEIQGRGGSNMEDVVAEKMERIRTEDLFSNSWILGMRGVEERYVYRIFPTQGLTLCLLQLPALKADYLPLSHRGNPSFLW